MMKYILHNICKNKISIEYNKDECSQVQKTKDYNYIYNKISDYQYITEQDFILINHMTNDDKMKLFELYNDIMRTIIQNLVENI